MHVGLWFVAFPVYVGIAALLDEHVRDKVGAIMGVHAHQAQGQGVTTRVDVIERVRYPIQRHYLCPKRILHLCALPIYSIRKLYLCPADLSNTETLSVPCRLLQYLRTV